MGCRFLLDEQLRGPLWALTEQHNSGGIHPLDVTRVGDPVDLPLGMPDPDILIWAEREGRILVSEDWRTMRGHFQAHLAVGQHSPGLFLLRPQIPYTDIVDFLVAVAYASEPDEWIDNWLYIP
jgi:hypothetical protein